AKATSSQAWLWHRRLSHLNFDTINLLSKNNIVNGLPKLKFVKDHLCSSCELGKAKRKWIPTGKLFDSCTSKIDSEPPHGSNVDIPHIHECKQTLDVSACTSINVQKEQSLDLSADPPPLNIHSTHQTSSQVSTITAPENIT
ncbi:retrovirus-related pol polyprotein from transposon TNT 1-94, partial [Tanacetum coccineum]